MNTSVFTKLTVIGVLLNAIGVLVASKWPEWAASLFFTKESSYSHFFSSKYIFEAVTLLFFVGFIVQIVFLVRIANLTVARLSFHAINDAFELRLFRFASTLIVMSIFTLSAGHFIKCLVNYAYALEREVRHAESNNWNWRVSRGNAALANGDSQTALAHYQAAIDGPGRALSSSTVYRMKRDVEKLKQSEVLSRDLVEKSRQLILKNQFYVAIELLQQAKSIYQYNLSAASNLDMLRDRFKGQKSVGSDFYSFCKHRRLDQLIIRSSEFGFFVRDSAFLGRNQDQLNSEQKAQLLWSVCIKARLHPSFEDYFASTERDLFDPKLPEVRQ